MSFEFFPNDAPDLLFGDISIQVAMKTEEAACDQTGKPGRQAGDGVNDLADETTGCRINDSAGIGESEIVETKDHLAEESSSLDGVEMGGESQQLILKNDRNHGSLGIEGLRDLGFCA
jgi:hypothetical protein